MILRLSSENLFCLLPQRCDRIRGFYENCKIPQDQENFGERIEWDRVEAEE